MHRYVVLEQFGSGTFGRLYKVKRATNNNNNNNINNNNNTNINTNNINNNRTDNNNLNTISDDNPVIPSDEILVLKQIQFDGISKQEQDETLNEVNKRK